MAESTGTEAGKTNADSGTAPTEKGKEADVKQDVSLTKEEKSTEKGKEGDKPAEGEKAPESQTKPDDKAAVVPEKYELKLPEGVLVDEGLMKEFTALGKELKWNNATAQKMADMHLKAIGLFANQQTDAHIAKIESWSKEVKDDKDIGGAKIDETMGQARKVMGLVGDIPGVNKARLVADLNESGLATHPDLIRVFHYFGQFIGADNKFIKGSPASQAPKDAAEILYGPTGVRDNAKSRS